MDSLDRKRKKRARKSFSHWLNHRFRLLFVDEDELRTMSSAKVSRGRLLLLALIAIVAVGAASISLYRHSPFQKRQDEKNFNMRQQLIDDMLRIDSIENVIAIHDAYSGNMRDVLLGKISVDSVPSIDSLVNNGSYQLEESSIDEREFVTRYEEQERYNVTAQSPGLIDVQNRNLYRPAAGVISEPFDYNRGHFGVDIAANPEESIVAVMDGTVLLSNYTAEDGYVISILHPGDMVSVYKYCSKVLKKEGDKVRAGDVVAFVGKTNSTYTSSHLHFELWYEGQPLDPQKYIVF